MADEEQATEVAAGRDDARPRIRGRGIARLPRAVMTELGLAEGDVIEIVGKRTTPARAVGPYPEDEGLDIIRLDGLQRANAEIGSGDFIDIRKAESKPAQRVVFAPAQKNLRLHGSAAGAQAQLRDEARSPPATSSPPPGSSRSTRGDIPAELRQMLNAPAYALQEIRLVVVSTVPKGIVHIDATTEVELKPEYAEAKETRRADVTYDDLGGMGATIDQLREMVELPLRYPEIFERPGRRSAQGRAAPRPARHRQDPARPRGRQRERRHLLPHRRPRNHGLGLWRVRKAAARPVRGGGARRRRRSSSSTRSIRSRPSAARCRARPRSGWSPSC